MLKNKYLISTDIEGISGVATPSFANLDGKHYETAKKYMISDTNAVIKGILKADPDGDIVVRDAHGGATNLDLNSLDSHAKLIQGWGDQTNMIFPLDPETKGIFLVGYHAGGHNNQAVLAHTFSGQVHYIKVNDRFINEAGLAGIFAGHYNIPISFISGDDHAISEAESFFENIVGVCVKQSYGRDCTLSLPLTESASLLADGACKATKELLDGKQKPLHFKLPMQVEFRLYNSGYKHSIFQNLYSILNYDQRFQFDLENFIIKFEADTQLEMSNIFTMLLFLVMGISNID